MTRARVDCAVVGAGVLGLAAARAIARRGRGVVVCEQATVGHVGGGSRGTARIFRLGYDDPGYVRLAMVAQRLWRQLEAEAAMSLVTTTGQMTFGDDLDVLANAMDEAGAPYERMSPAEVATRFPAFSVSTPALYEPASGVIAADRCLAALRHGPGIDVRERTRVVRCEEEGTGVRLVLQGPEKTEELRASVVVGCAGPWTAALVGGLDVPLRALPTLEQVAYLRPAPGSAAGSTTESPIGGSVDAMPVFVERRRPWFYGLPDRPRGLMKISLHGGGPAVALDDLLDDGLRERDDAALVTELTRSAKRVLPGFVPEPVSTERCVYDNAPDGDFVVDRVGPVVIGSGTSGHAFKFAPLLGELLAELATGENHRDDLGTIADLARFAVGHLRGARTDAGPTVHP